MAPGYGDYHNTATRIPCKSCVRRKKKRKQSVLSGEKGKQRRIVAARKNVKFRERECLVLEIGRSERAFFPSAFPSARQIIVIGETCRRTKKKKKIARNCFSVISPAYAMAVFWRLQTSLTFRFLLHGTKWSANIVNGRSTYASETYHTVPINLSQIFRREEQRTSTALL